MRISNFLFYLFVAVFFAFAVAFTNLVNYTMVDEEGGSRFWLTRITLLLVMVCVALMMQYLTRSYKGIHIICLLWLLIMPINMVVNHAELYDVLRTVLWPLLFEATYLCCLRCTKRENSIRYVYFAIAFLGAYYFIITRLVAGGQTNTIYFCFLTLPWLLYRSSNKTEIILLLLFTFLAILSIKRSTMLACVFIWFFYIIRRLKSGRSMVISLIVFAAIFYFVYTIYDQVDARYEGFLSTHVTREETVDEGRLALWNTTIAMITMSSPTELFFGHGHFGVRRDSIWGESAHNDFLEVIYDYGVFIFILYLFLFYYVIKRCVFLYKAKSLLFLPFSVSLSIFIVMSFVSHLVLYATYFNYLVMFWGMTEASVDTKKYQIQN